MVLLLAAWARVGVHVSRPVAGLRERPVGAPGASCQVRVCRGRSGSVALSGSESLVCSSTLIVAGGGVMAGRVLTRVTTTLNDCVALRLGEPLSVTTSVKD